jgi:phosphoribosyl 1,2-cyclic phosphodiesterase
MRKVQAIFITHEHFDHTKGAVRLSKKYQIPVFITGPTLQQGRLRIQEHLVKPFKPYQPEVIGKLTVTAFPKFHDAVDPHSFIVSNETVNVAVITDIGAACEHVISNFGK